MNQRPRTRHVALQFGRIKHFNEGLSEFSRQLGLALAQQAVELRESRGIQFHFILEKQWHGMFGDAVQYHALTDEMRFRHAFPVALDVWHGLHQHMRYRPPVNSQHNIITVHDLNHVYAKTGLSLWWQNLRLKRQLRQADELVAISHHVAQDIQQHLHWAAIPRVIHNGVADLRGTPQESVQGVPPDEYMLHISRMSPSKNVETLIELAAIWPEQPFVLVGPASPEVERHRRNVMQQQLKNVQFLTDVSVQEKAWLLAHCKAFLFPSLQEGFGLPPIEAMYFGKPVIVANRTSLPEVCGAGAAYWDNFAAKSMRHVVEKHLITFLADTLKHEKIRHQAMNYTWLRAAQQYMASYTKDCPSH